MVFNFGLFDWKYYLPVLNNIFHFIFLIMLEIDIENIEKALKSIEEDDLDTLKSLVPKVVPINLRIREYQ